MPTKTPNKPAKAAKAAGAPEAPTLKKKPALRLRNPPPRMVTLAREFVGLSQQEAADIVHLSAYQRWAEYERGVRVVDAARWELFLLHTGLHPKYKPLTAAA